MLGESSTGVTSGMRRLAAIMSADIAGFSRLMEHDEEGTHARLKRYRRDIIEPTVNEHHGQIVKHVGDGFLAIFDSPLEATRCAIVIQQTIAARNAALAKELWLQYRIGINLGDVLVEPDDVYGDGVNVAARLQAAAAPGEVNIAGGVYEQVKNKLVCGYQSLGDEKLKNITDPVRIYRVLPDPAAVRRAKPLRRALRIGVPAAAALGLAFGGGLWLAGQMNTQRSAPPTATATTGTKNGTLPAIAAAVPERAPVSARQAAPPVAGGPNTLPGLPPVPAPPPPLPALPGPISEQPAASPAGPRVAVLPPPVKPETGPAEGTFRDCQRCPEMIRVPTGSFLMGSNEDPTEQPPHRVTVSAFAMGRHPVTMGEWRACVAAKACQYEPSGDDGLPVSNISWDDAQQYLAWLSKATGRPYRLPSEAEWEYAARGGTATAYWWGASFAPGMANCKGCGEPYDATRPAKVATFRPNGFGLYDMAGGVNQWVADCWHRNYQRAPADGSAWTLPNCRERVLRGGSWRSSPTDVRVASRASYESSVRYPAHGFRVALREK
jgi:formylglycine-generating enzyme required for sulfatase activity/class 3 adenylate cyclase